MKILHQSPLFKGGGSDKVADGGLFEKHYPPRNKNLKLPARELRKNSTKQENHIWHDYLSKFYPRFLRQYVIKNYILDFYCKKAALTIEIDGSQHYEEEALEYDKSRTEYLNGLGIEVLRFSNKDVDINFAEVCKKIKATVQERVSNPPSATLSPPPPLKRGLSE